MRSASWPFDQSPNCAVLTVRPIAFSGAPILRVSHDIGDHGWQFLDSGDPDQSQAALLALSEIVQLDPTVLEVADLPVGWLAWRDSKVAPWQRRKRSDNGV